MPTPSLGGTVLRSDMERRADGTTSLHVHHQPSTEQFRSLDAQGVDLNRPPSTCPQDGHVDDVTNAQSFQFNSYLESNVGSMDSGAQTYPFNHPFTSNSDPGGQPAEQTTNNSCPINSVTQSAAHISSGHPFNSNSKGTLAKYPLGIHLFTPDSAGTGQYPLSRPYKTQSILANQLTKPRTDQQLGGHAYMDTGRPSYPTNAAVTSNNFSLQHNLALSQPPMSMSSSLWPMDNIFDTLQDDSNNS